MGRQTRREFLKAMGVTAASAAASSLLPGSAGISQAIGTERKRPNIIFIMTDDHASHALSCYGSKINNTPNLDRLAREGMRFNNAFCTNSLCEPSRAVILTGKYSHVNGIVNNAVKFGGGQQTFPKLLQTAGYETAVIGKWHLKSVPTDFDYWNILPGQGLYYNPVMVEMGQRKKYEGYVTDIITDFCLKWLKARKADKPFCLLYHHKAPHEAWQPAPRHLTLYDDIEIAEPQTLFDDYNTRCDAARVQWMTIGQHLSAKSLKMQPPKGLTKQQLNAWNAAYEPKNEALRRANLSGKDLVRWKYQRYIKDYLRCIASVDENVGRLLDYLDASGLAENTIVVYTSDQGFFLGEHGWYDKRFMYEQSLRIPLLICYPKEVKPGSVSEDMVLNLDFAETFLDFAGVARPSDMQGRSIRPLLQGNTPGNWRSSMYYHFYEYPGYNSVKRHYGIRTSRYKLIHFYYDINAWELYDLHKDPNELNNVYGSPAYADVVNQLKAELERLRKQYGDSCELTKKILAEHPRGNLSHLPVE